MRIGALGLLALAGIACSASTDRPSYAPSDAGSATFRNDSDVTAWLEGCSAYSFEQRFDGRWQDAGPAVVCVWEGLARPVPPAESLTLPLLAPDEPGTWRLRYSAAVDCEPDLPLSQAECAWTAPVYTPAFTVGEQCAPGACGPPLGMPNLLCPDGQSVAGPTGRCLRDPESDLCGWEIAECPDDPPAT